MMASEDFRVVKNGRIKQSLAYWCLNGTDWQWDIDRICDAALQLGCLAVEPDVHGPGGRPRHRWRRGRRVDVAQARKLKRTGSICWRRLQALS